MPRELPGAGGPVKTGEASVQELDRDIKDYRNEIRRKGTLEARKKFLKNEIVLTQEEINRGGCPLREVAKAMKIREEGSEGNKGLIENIWMNPDECVNYITSRPTCKDAACPAADYPHYHSHDVGACSGAELFGRDTVVWIPMTNIDRSQPARGNHLISGFAKPATTVGKISCIRKALNPSGDPFGSATIFAFVIEQMMPPVQLGVLGMKDNPEEAERVDRALQPRRDYYKALEKYRNQEIQAKHGVVVEGQRLVHPGEAPAAASNEMQARWKATHCYAVFLDLVEQRCLVVDELSYIGSPFKVEQSEAVQVRNFKCLREVLDPKLKLPVIADQKAEARRVLSKNCRMIYGEMEDTVCLTSAYNTVYNFITSRADFDKAWESAAKRAFRLNG